MPAGAGGACSRPLLTFSGRTVGTLPSEREKGRARDKKRERARQRTREIERERERESDSEKKRQTERERESECVCVCVSERERAEGGGVCVSLQTMSTLHTYGEGTTYAGGVTPLSNELETHKPVKEARFWPWHQIFSVPKSSNPFELFHSRTTAIW